MKPSRQSPGFRRMMEQMGPDAFERLRLDTLLKQEEAMAGVRETLVKRPLNENHNITRDVIKGKRK